MKNTLLKRIVMVVLLSLTALLSTSCNTVEGAGRDIERGGEAIQDVAD